MICDRFAPRCRHMETSLPGVCGNLQHMVWMIGKVESSSTFPTLMTLPTKTIFIGNMCLRWSVSYRQHTIVRLETCPIRPEASSLLLSAIASDLNGNICLLCLRSSAITLTQTASDGHRPWQIIWKPGFTALTVKERNPIFNKLFLIMVSKIASTPSSVWVHFDISKKYWSIIYTRQELSWYYPSVLCQI